MQCHAFGYSGFSSFYQGSVSVSPCLSSSTYTCSFNFWRVRRKRAKNFFFSIQRCTRVPLEEQGDGDRSIFRISLGFAIFFAPFSVLLTKFIQKPIFNISVLRSAQYSTAYKWLYHIPRFFSLMLVAGRRKFDTEIERFGKNLRKPSGFFSQIFARNFKSRLTSFCRRLNYKLKISKKVFLGIEESIKTLLDFTNENCVIPIWVFNWLEGGTCKKKATILCPILFKKICPKVLGQKLNKFLNFPIFNEILCRILKNIFLRNFEFLIKVWTFFYLN